MSVRWITWAWDQDCANPGEKLTLIALADHAGEDGHCWPSTGRLIEKTGVGRSTVFRHLDGLERAGMLRREARYRDDGSQTSSLIVLGGGGPGSERGGSRIETGGGPKSGRQEEPSVEPSLEPTPLPPASGGARLQDTVFGVFYDAYPHKVGKPAARKAFKAAMVKERNDPGELMVGLMRWRRYWHECKTEMKFIPHPSTWLNQERWNDPCPNVVLMAPRDRARAALEAMVQHPSNGGQHELG